MEQQSSGWNSYGRVNASERWRKPSALMGSDVTKAIVDEAKVERGMRVLDVACGTGEPALSIATLLDGTGHVVASDISSGPLEIGRERARERGLTNIEFLQADVQQLPFPDESFDRLTCRLGVMFFPDCDNAMREMMRVLKPGGRASVLAWGSIQQPYFDTTLGTILRTNPELKLPESGLKMFKFAKPGTLTVAFREAGFAYADEHSRTVPWTWHGDPQDVWEYFQAVTIPFAPLFAAVPEERRAAVTEAVVDSIRRYVVDGEVRFGATIVLASATR